MTDVFHKMQGLGNDFMLIDATLGWSLPDAHIIRQWADRRTGIGFDQLIYVSGQPNNWRYQFFNADGSEAEQCGNGQRALALYLSRQYQATWPQVVDGLGGKVSLSVIDEDHIKVIIQGAIECHSVGAGMHVNVGNPHWVLVVDDVQAEGFKHWREQAKLFFPQGVNIELVEQSEPGEIVIRIWERGTGETQACGSGACAAAWALTMDNQQSTYKVSMHGGILQVICDRNQGTICMTGSARHVFQGVITG